MKKAFVITSTLVSLMLSATAFASPDERGDRVDNRLDSKGERINNPLDRRVARRN